MSTSLVWGYVLTGGMRVSVYYDDLTNYMIVVGYYDDGRKGQRSFMPKHTPLSEIHASDRERVTAIAKEISDYLDEEA